MKDVAPPPSYDEAVKRQTEKASGSSDKEPRHKRGKEQFCDGDKMGQEEGEAEESSSCDEDDVWATEDEDNDDNENETDSSEEEYNASCRVGTRQTCLNLRTRKNFRRRCARLV